MPLSSPLAPAVLALLLALPASAGVPADPPPAGSGLSPEQVATGVLGAMDPKADPCQDFYRYACGGWLEQSRIPPDRSTWSRSFSVVDERNREAIRTLLEDAAQNPGTDADRRRIGGYYQACMDESAVEKAGSAPLRPWLDEISRVADQKSLMAVAGKLQAQGPWGPLLGLGVIPDFKRPDLDIAFFVQGGLGLPDRDYYVSEDPKKQEILAGYQRHVADMLALLGESPEAAAGHARQVVAFETELAKASRPRQEMRIPEKLYNKIDIGGLKQLTPGLDWGAFLAATGYPGVKDINVATPEFFTALERAVAAASPEVLQAYLRWHLVHGAADVLSRPFVDADFAFYGKTLSGQQEIEPRWKRCGRATEQALGEAVGKLYVDKFFAGDSKRVALEMIHDIEGAFAQSLPQLAWMDEATRRRALEKRDALGNKIGYPDAWRDYSKMALGGDYFANATAAAAFEFRRQADKIGKPVDRGEWGMTPQMVNAYYNPLLNEIAFPAGILQPPFFHQDFPAAMNYGAIGMVVGHELTHGFDDQGRKFDPKGELREWWDPSVASRFEERAQCVAEQYSRYEVEPGLALNGKLTLGENIADIGGLKQSWDAFRAWQVRHGGPGPTVGSLTPEQLFFVAHGQVWCQLMSPEQARLRVTTDPHSPGKYRVIGPIANHPAFAAAFACPAGAPMNPSPKCEVW
jgi:predicted metalloendopeptidase